MKVKLETILGNILLIGNAKLVDESYIYAGKVKKVDPIYSKYDIDWSNIKKVEITPDETSTD